MYCTTDSDEKDQKLPAGWASSSTSPVPIIPAATEEPPQFAPPPQMISVEQEQKPPPPEKVDSCSLAEIWPNPFGEDATPESMQEALDNIKSIDHWSSRFGQLRGHDTNMIDTVSRLVTEGVQQWGSVTAGYGGFTNATAATFWIMLYTENNGDQKLYSKLADCAQYFHPYVWTAETCQTMAIGFLRSTAQEMETEGVQEMNRQFDAMDFAYRWLRLHVKLPSALIKKVLEYCVLL